MKDARFSQPDWLAADWGTSHLRIWAIGGEAQVIGRKFGNCGMSHISKQDFEAEFINLAEPFLSEDRTLDVICCGMAGSRQGWSEAAYVSVPCHPPNIARSSTVRTLDPRIMRILPGVNRCPVRHTVRTQSEFRGRKARL